MIDEPAEALVLNALLLFRRSLHGRLHYRMRCLPDAWRRVQAPAPGKGRASRNRRVGDPAETCKLDADRTWWGRSAADAGDNGAVVRSGRAGPPLQSHHPGDLR